MQIPDFIRKLFKHGKRKDLQEAFMNHIAESIDGINAVELLPVFKFDESGFQRRSHGTRHPTTSSFTSRRISATVRVPVLLTMKIVSSDLGGAAWHHACSHAVFDAALSISAVACINGISRMYKRWQKLM
ncbi:hypothetical protein Tco_0668128 [Tanacetum coccineum]